MSETPDRLTSHSLTVADALKALQENIQAEDTLIASRITWYVTSQAFLITAYATSWNNGFVWLYFFHTALPITALLLSLLILASIFAATWAQDVYLREQIELVNKIRSSLILTKTESLALDIYERTMVGNRSNIHGRVVGGKIHALVRITPLALPCGFSLLWLYAIWFAPRM